MAAHARDVNILIWTSRKSVDHGTNDRVMVHGEGTRADGRRFRCRAKISEIMGLRSGGAARNKRRPCEVKISMYGVDDPDVVQIGSPENYHATDSD